MSLGVRAGGGLLLGFAVLVLAAGSVITSQANFQEARGGSVLVGATTLEPPVNLSGSALGLGQVSLTWQAPQQGLAPAGYDVYRRVAPAGSYQLQGSTTGTSFSQGSLTALTTYDYAVRSTWGDWESAFSNTVRCTVALFLVVTCDLLGLASESGEGDLQGISAPDPEQSTTLEDEGPGEEPPATATPLPALVATSTATPPPETATLIPTPDPTSGATTSPIPTGTSAPTETPTLTTTPTPSATPTPEPTATPSATAEASGS